MIAKNCKLRSIYHVDGAFMMCWQTLEHAHLVVFLTSEFGFHTVPEATEVCPLSDAPETKFDGWRSDNETNAG